MKIETLNAEPTPLTRDELIVGQVYRYEYDGMTGMHYTNYVIACHGTNRKDVLLVGLNDDTAGELFAGDAKNARFYPVSATLRVSE